MHMLRWTLIALSLISGLLVSASACAQAFCALRDPVTSIYGFFPDADGHRSIVRVVGNAARNTVGERLPLDLHFNELGKHTIYVAISDDKPIGIVHARSEGDVWGLTEIVWAFDLDLRVVDFNFQRCRNPARQALLESSFRSQLRGKSFAEIRSLLSDDATTFRTGAVTLPAEANKLGVTVTQSALKTALVTEVVWEAELRSLRTQNLLKRHFTGSVQTEAMPTPYTPQVLEQLAGQQLVEEIGIRRDALAMSRISSEQNPTLGFLVDTQWWSGSTEARLQWLLSADGRVLDVTASGIGASEVRESLDSLVGFEPSSAAHCGNALELSAFELGLLARQHSKE